MVIAGAAKAGVQMELAETVLGNQDVVENMEFAVPSIISKQVHLLDYNLKHLD